MDSFNIFFKEYDYDEAKQWLVDHEGFLLKCIAVYVVTIFTVKHVMTDRKPFGLQTPLTWWNAFLAVFSIAGFVQMTPTFIKVCTQQGVQETYTHITELQTGKTAGYWAFLWVVSKIPELIDTLFIVARKRPLMFMHWYHHAFTGYFSFVNFYEDNAYMIWVVYMNYFIHSFMYSYYCAAAMRVRIPPQFAQLMTGAQIVQFLITHAVMGHLLWLSLTTTNQYDVTLRGYFIGAFMEVTYLMLWFRFYYISYIQNGGKKYLRYVNATKSENGTATRKVHARKSYKDALKGQVALVTGGSRGIGRGIALQLGEAGATVYVTGRQKSPDQQQSTGKYPTLEETANEITFRGGKGIFVYCDHEDEKQVEELFGQIAREQDGQLDILVNNAYAAVMTNLSSAGKKSWELPTSVYDTINNTGLRNHYVCAVFAAKLMVPRRKGLMVTVGSYGGGGYLLNVAYGLGKAGCDKLAADMAAELRNFNITSVSLWPGPAKTELVLENVLNRKENLSTKSLFATGESIEYSGKGVVALAADPDKLELTGKILTSDCLGKTYGLTDIDGATIDHKVHKSLEGFVESLNNYRAPTTVRRG